MLIGLCGAAGCGKGSVAAFLVSGSAGFVEMAFADPLYAAVEAITGISQAKLKDRQFKEAVIDWIGKSPRELLQLMGTEYGRKMIKESFWIDRAMQTVDRYSSADVNVVITDVRFDNEAEAVKARGGSVWKVVRDAPTCLTGSAAGHESEAGISPHYIDQIIANDGSLEDLRRVVDAALREATGLYN